MRMFLTVLLLAGTTALDADKSHSIRTLAKAVCSQLDAHRQLPHWDHVRAAGWRAQTLHSAAGWRAQTLHSAALTLSRDKRAPSRLGVTSVNRGKATERQAWVDGKGDLQTVERLLSQGVGPDEKSGASPLWEAANNADTAMVALLLSYAANSSRAEPATLTTPLHIAVAKGSDQVVKLLLSYGASADVVDDKGISPKRAALKAARPVQTLFETLDKHGPVGLEDPPGTWQVFENDQGMRFYFNPSTQETRWLKPPSCSWARSTVQGQPIYYNHITRQSLWVMPPSLSWKKVHLPGAEPFWLNFRTNATSAKTPAELPAELVQELESAHNKYFFNVVTGQSQWSDPRETQWNPLTDHEGRRYWFRPSTGDSTYDLPAEAAWREMRDANDRLFYYNDATSETTWTKPAPLGWMHHSEL